MRMFVLLSLLLAAAPLRALELLIKPSPEKAVGETEIQASSEPAKGDEINAPNKVLPGEPAVRKNYLLPAVEIPLFLLGLNAYDRKRYGEAVYGTNFGTFKEHLLHGHWQYDQDPFAINQFAHPLQGALMYDFARSSGLNFWESALYSNAGSFLWKMGGETGQPSRNDQITTGNAGAIFGEELYRMGSLVLERGGKDGEKPAAWREWTAALISPPTGLNRLMFGDRYKWMESRDPATFTRLRVGQDSSGQVKDTRPDHASVRPGAVVDFTMDYGLPGKDGYRYLRPLDYFSFEITGAANAGDNPIANVLTRGLLFGSKYEAGDDYRGVWGLYGSYDYISPRIYRVSSTAGSLGTTAQWWLSKKTALQGTALAGVGFGAAGSTNGTGVPVAGERDYHYGTTPQALLALRLLLHDRVMLDATGREYFVSRLGGTEAGSENISRVDASATVRVFGHQALGVNYVFSRREARYPGTPVRHQSVSTVGVAYTLLGDPHLGAVDWR